MSLVFSGPALYFHDRKAYMKEFYRRKELESDRVRRIEAGLGGELIDKWQDSLSEEDSRLVDVYFDDVWELR